MNRLWLRRVAIGTGCTGIGAAAGGIFIFSPDAKRLAERRHKLMGLDTFDFDNSSIFSECQEYAMAMGNPSGVFRFGLAAATVATVAWDYRQLKRRRDRSKTDWDWLSGYGLGGEDSKEYRNARASVHERSSQQVYQLCHRLGGVYTKMGQYVATLNHVLPGVWTSKLSLLQDRAASKLLDSEMREMLEKELGMPLDKAFCEFDEKPLAAASLAQVHRAVVNLGELKLNDESMLGSGAEACTSRIAHQREGESKSSHLEVAVKVQYPHLGAQVVGDLWAMEVLANAVGYFFEDFEYAWLLPEFEKTADMELDFLQEVNNSRRASSMLSARKDTHIPFVIEELSSRRVMTMEFIHGHRIDDADSMLRDGIDPVKVASTVTDVFGEMIYRHGFIHCDPHPGNLLVRCNSEKNNGYELVILDHGMYRRLDQSFRRAHCLLWKSLLTQDSKLGSKTMTALGLNDIGYETLSLILTFRTPTGDARVGGRMSDSERKRIREKYRYVTAGDVNRFMQSLPRDMLFVLRTNDIVRSLNKSLGGTSRSRFITMGEWAVRGLSIPNVPSDSLENIFLCSTGSWLPSSLNRPINKSVDSECEKWISNKHRKGLYDQLEQSTCVLMLHIRLWFIDKYLGFRWWWYGYGHKKPKRALG